MSLILQRENNVIHCQDKKGAIRYEMMRRELITVEKREDNGGSR